MSVRVYFVFRSVLIFSGVFIVSVGWVTSLAVSEKKFVGTWTSVF